MQLYDDSICAWKRCKSDSDLSYNGLGLCDTHYNMTSEKCMKPCKIKIPYTYWEKTVIESKDKDGNISESSVWEKKEGVGYAKKTLSFELVLKNCKPAIQKEFKNVSK